MLRFAFYVTKVQWTQNGSLTSFSAAFNAALPFLPPRFHVNFSAAVNYE
jgi:hypothetical protein